MNVAYPPTEFISDSDAVSGFKTLLIEGFENPYKSVGRVRITVPENASLSFTATLDEHLIIEDDCDQQDCDTEIIIPISTVHRIFEEFEFLDFRDPDFIGTIELKGRLGTGRSPRKVLPSSIEHNPCAIRKSRTAPCTKEISRT